MKLLSVFILALVLAACSTTRTPVAPTFNDGQTKITFVRDTGYSGSGCAVAATINGKIVGLLEESEQLHVPVEPGSITVGADGEPNAGLCSYGDWEEFQTTIRPGEVQYFRIGVYMDPIAWVPLIGLAAQSGPYVIPYEQEYKPKDKS